MQDLECCQDMVAQMPYLDSSLPQSRTDLAPLFQEAGVFLATAKGHDVNIDIVLTKLLGVLVCLHTHLGDREDAINTEGDAHTGNLALGREHVDQIVVTATGSDRAHPDRRVVRSVLVGVARFATLLLGRLLGASSGSCGRRAFCNDLVDHASII